VSLSQRSGLPLVEDLGSGCLSDLSEYGVSEPTVKQSIDAGVSIVMFSGDNFLAGHKRASSLKKELITRVRRYPLFRALRVDNSPLPLSKPLSGLIFARPGTKSPPFE